MTPDAFLDSIPIPLVMVRPDKMLGPMNSAAAELFGEGMSGRHYTVLFRSPAIIKRIEAALANQGAGKARYRKTDAGRRRTYRAHVAPMPAEAGALVTMLDITAEKDAGKMRSDFVANVSHELRTPLTALTGIVETLQGPARDDIEARNRFLSLMAREAARMNRLVQDLLSLSQVENREHQRSTEKIDLSMVILAARSSLLEQAKKQETKLVVRGCDAPIVIPGDPDQLRQVFNNLVENAIKYGGEGGQVTVSATREKRQPLVRGPGVRIDVEDQGEGISSKHLGRLTERFYRADKHRSRDMGGTGLGLAIVKHIVNRHRGRLRITSTPGEGSCFTVFLPAK